MEEDETPHRLSYQLFNIDGRFFAPARSRKKLEKNCGRIIGHCCSKAVPVYNTSEGVYKKPIINHDRMHWCMGISFGRMNARLRCSDNAGDALIACERRCNVAMPNTCLWLNWDDGKENEKKMVELANY